MFPGRPMFHFSIADLTLFSAIADERNLTRGAARVHLSVPAASIRLKRLEDALDVQLVTRLPRGIELTEAGKALDRHAKAILRQLDELTAEVAPYARLGKGMVRIVSNYISSVDYLPTDISRFLSAHPTARVHLDQKPSDRVVEMVATGRADIGVSAFTGDYPNVRFHPYHEDALVVVLPKGHPLEEKERVDYSETLRYEFVTLDRHSAMQTFLFEHANALGHPIEPRAEVDNPLILMRLVSQGQGIGIVSLKTYETLSPAIEVGMVRLSNPWALRHLRIVVPAAEESLNGTVREFLGLLLREAEKDPAGG